MTPNLRIRCNDNQVGMRFVPNSKGGGGGGAGGGGGGGGGGKRSPGDVPEVSDERYDWVYNRFLHAKNKPHQVVLGFAVEGYGVSRPPGNLEGSFTSNTYAHGRLYH